MPLAMVCRPVQPKTGGGAILREPTGDAGVGAPRSSPPPHDLSQRNRRYQRPQRKVPIGRLRLIMKRRSKHVRDHHAGAPERDINESARHIARTKMKRKALVNEGNGTFKTLC
jgi:hypothetical protein